MADWLAEEFNDETADRPEDEIKWENASSVASPPNDGKDDGGAASKIELGGVTHLAVLLYSPRQRTRFAIAAAVEPATNPADCLACGQRNRPHGTSRCANSHSALGDFDSNPTTNDATKNGSSATGGVDH